MSDRDSRVAEVLIADQGMLYGEEAGADISKDTPQELFHWLVTCIMLAARIDARLAVQGAAALRREGLHKIDAILAADRGDLVRVLNENGYARYDESTADYLRDTADWAQQHHGGDLRHLRDESDDSDVIFDALQGAKGLGPVGAGIFAREAQLVWDPFYPWLSGRALDGAAKLGLPDEPQELSRLAGSREGFVRLVAALTRVALDGPAERVREAAG